MSLPLWSVRLLISIPCSEKKPFLIPRSIGSAFAIGSVFTVIVTVACGLAGALAAVAPKATTTASSPETESPRSLVPRPPFVLFRHSLPPRESSGSHVVQPSAAASRGAGSCSLLIRRYTCARRCAKSASSFVSIWSRGYGSPTGMISFTSVGACVSTTMRSER